MAMLVASVVAGVRSGDSIEVAQALLEPPKEAGRMGKALSRCVGGAALSARGPLHSDGATLYAHLIKPVGVSMYSIEGWKALSNRDVALNHTCGPIDPLPPQAQLRVRVCASHVLIPT
jgi:hypothetical protein